MRSKEELDVLIREQQSIFEGVRDKLRNLEDERTLVVELPKRKEYVGRFFKNQTSFGTDTGTDPWWVYMRVVEALGRGLQGCSELRVVSFEKDGLGEVNVDSRHLKRISGLGDEITEAEYLAEWSKLACEADLAIRGMKR